ncbi:MAG: type II secretion system F family protein [bacterium]
MNIIILMFLIISISILIYIFIDDEHNDLLQARLTKISQVNHIEEENKEEKFSLKEEIYKLLEPFLASFLKRKDKMKSTRQLLLEAGYASGEEEASKFVLKKIFFALMGVIIGICMSLMNRSAPLFSLFSLFICTYGMFKFPDFQLKSIIKKRSDDIAYNLPDALDLLTVCVEAGLGLDAALSRVSVEFNRTAPVLAKELGKVNKDILAGVQRQDAFRNLANRNNVPDLKSFTALLIQTDKLGTSIAQSLRVYADTVRTRRRQRVEALAAKASVKMIIPMVLFILPSMFIVLMGPAAISLMGTFGKSGIGK